MNKNNKVALITGAAHRLGKSIAVELHEREINIAIHCGQSIDKARSLCDQLNHKRTNSASVFQYDLIKPNATETLVGQIIQTFGRLDYLVNNASVFYPTPFLETPCNELDVFMQINFILPVKLTQAAFPYLKKSHGAVVNIIDIYAQRGLTKHCYYTASKMALLEATKELAYRFAPDIRVNGVSPGAILWPTNSGKQDQSKQKLIIENTALKRAGIAQDVSLTVAYLLLDALYTTGNIINVDGGRQLYI
jgi:pteridine reductase